MGCECCEPRELTEAEQALQSVRLKIKKGKYDYIDISLLTLRDLIRIDGTAGKVWFMPGDISVTILYETETLPKTD